MGGRGGRKSTRGVLGDDLAVVAGPPGNSGLRENILCLTRRLLVKFCTNFIF